MSCIAGRCASRSLDDAYRINISALFTEWDDKKENSIYVNGNQVSRYNVFRMLFSGETLIMDADAAGRISSCFLDLSSVSDSAALESSAASSSPLNASASSFHSIFVDCRRFTDCRERKAFIDKKQIEATADDPFATPVLIRGFFFHSVNSSVSVGWR